MIDMISGRDVMSQRNALKTFISEKLKVYPTIGEGLDKLTDVTGSGDGLQLISIENLAKCWSFKVSQRGVTYIVTRGSSIRGTHGYETLSYHKLKDDTPSNVEDNPLITIQLILRDLDDEELLSPN